MKISGNSLQPSYSTAKIIWYRENQPEVYEKIYKILQSQQLHRIQTDRCDEHRMFLRVMDLHCFDMKKGMPGMKTCAEQLGIPDGIPSGNTVTVIMW